MTEIDGTVELIGEHGPTPILDMFAEREHSGAGVLDRFACSWGFVELATAELLRAGGIHGVLLIGVGEPLLAEPIPLLSVAGMVLTVAGLALVLRPATRNDPGTIWNA